ncbi:MAG: aspartate carbamoyltransferase regulatory subunit [Euryarchaeota archaeon]|nr:aspartate carbamoyltransferase regulatory subunit [Euryarchaeota archaeon]|tara:strand:- start:2951 stop:3424 length:474 start_codon:yes stop_codon:yes gene_type:complete
MSEEGMRRVTAIQNGTIIDHVPAGSSLKILGMLGLLDNRSTPISFAMNVPSKKLDRKDVMKVEDRELTQQELDRLAIIAPDASVSIIRDYRVVEKRTVELGDELTNVARCSYSNCIMNNPREPLPHRILVHSRNPLELRCAYCGKTQSVDDIVNHLI